MHIPVQHRHLHIMFYTSFPTNSTLGTFFGRITASISETILLYAGRWFQIAAHTTGSSAHSQQLLTGEIMFWETICLYSNSEGIANYWKRLVTTWGKQSSSTVSYIQKSGSGIVKMYSLKRVNKGNKPRLLGSKKNYCLKFAHLVLKAKVFLERFSWKVRKIVGFKESAVAKLEFGICKLVC